MEFDKPKYTRVGPMILDLFEHTLMYFIDVCLNEHFTPTTTHKDDKTL